MNIQFNGGNKIDFFFLPLELLKRIEIQPVYEFWNVYKYV